MTLYHYFPHYFRKMQQILSCFGLAFILLYGLCTYRSHYCYVNTNKNALILNNQYWIIHV